MLLLPCLTVMRPRNCIATMASARSSRSRRNRNSAIDGSGRWKNFHHWYSLPKFHGHFCTYTTRSPTNDRLVLMLRSNESTSVNTAMMAKMPIVTPSNESVVRRRLDRNACHANRKLSNT